MAPTPYDRFRGGAWFDHAMKNSDSGNAQDGTRNGGSYADSMEAAASMLGRSVELLQRLKAMGCQAFRGSRVHLEELEEFIAENNIEEIELEIEQDAGLAREIKRRKLAVQDQLIRKLTFKNDAEEGKYVLVERVTSEWVRVAHRAKDILVTKLEDEAPDRMAMRSSEELRPMCRKIVDEICDAMRSMGYSNEN